MLAWRCLARRSVKNDCRMGAMRLTTSPPSRRPLRAGAPLALYDVKGWLIENERCLPATVVRPTRAMRTPSTIRCELHLSST